MPSAPPVAARSRPCTIRPAKGWRRPRACSSSSPRPSLPPLLSECSTIGIMARGGGDGWPGAPCAGGGGPQHPSPGGAFITGSLSGRTLFISGASRGIGLAIALRAARDGANIIVAAKSTTAHPKLPGTIYEAAAAIERAGGQALPLAVDIREEAQVAAAVQAGVARFGGIDCLVNNASAISLSGALETPMKRFELMMPVTLRGTSLCSQACLPHLLGAPNPHILTLSPPLNFDPRWFRGHPAYTISKYAMSLCVLGLAAEFADRGVAVNGLWPKTVIATAALNVIPGMDPRRA